MTLISDGALDRKRQIRRAKLAEFVRFIRRFRRNRLGVAGLSIILLLVLSAVFAPLLATHDPYLPNLAKRLSAPDADTGSGPTNSAATSSPVSSTARVSRCSSSCRR
jgi:peptide/nickel transport system permease protein